MQFIEKMWRDEQGASMVEYATLIALLSIAILGALGLMGTSIMELFIYAGTLIDEAIPIGSSSFSWDALSIFGSVGAFRL